MISDTPISRRNRSIDAQPAAKKEKVEFEEPFSEKKQAPLTSETDVNETGAETWLEASRKASLDDKKGGFAETESEEEVTSENSEEPIVAKAESVETSDPELGEETEEIAAKEEFAEPELETESQEQPNLFNDGDDEEAITNPIALAAAEAAEKNKAVLELEAAQNDKSSDDDDSELGAAAQPKETLAEGSMGALLGGLSTDVDVAMSADKVEVPAEQKSPLENQNAETDSTGPLAAAKMPSDYAPPSKKDASPKDRPIRCFKCNHRQMVSLAASSTQCGRCSVYISLSDYDIKSSQSQTIRTRGNVTIHRRGSLVGCDVACHDLTVLGKISGSVDCSGNATFKNSGKVMGSMHCKHLHVDKKCELTFPQGVVAESADIHGIVNGNITCSGTIKILKTGAVNGDAKAKAIVLKDGGILSGQMSIQHDVDIELPIKRGYDPSIIN